MGDNKDPDFQNAGFQKEVTKKVTVRSNAAKLDHSVAPSLISYVCDNYSLPVSIDRSIESSMFSFV